MGNAASVGLDPRMVNIWQKLAYIQSDEARIGMLETLLAGPEYVSAAKRGGVYAFVLQWIASYRRGERPLWPGQRVQAAPPQAPPSQQTAPPRQTTQRQTQPTYSAAPSTAIATVPPPKRALDALHQAYDDLGIDDSRPLTYDSLRIAYKKAATKAHPDRGGSSEEFDAVTRSFLFLEEVIKKLVPSGPDTKAPVTMEAALKARSMPLTKPNYSTHDIEEYNADRAATNASAAAAAASAPRGDEPPVALNPKKLDMNLFNRLFEENRMPDPDQDGYGDWLKTNGDEARVKNAEQLRSKFNHDVFNRTFVEQTKQANNATALTRHQTPDAIVAAQGVELGGGRPAHYTSAMGSKTTYTDLKYAYGEGSTFSQDVEDVNWDKKNFDQMKRERESAPVPLSEHESSVLAAVEAQKVRAEQERQRRLAARDVETEDVYTRMQRRLLIQK